jgi:hypothetical protein
MLMLLLPLRICVVCFRRFRGTCCLHLQHWSEQGGLIFVGIYWFWPTRREVGLVPGSGQYHVSLSSDTTALLVQCTEQRFSQNISLCCFVCYISFTVLWCYMSRRLFVHNLLKITPNFQTSNIFYTHTVTLIKFSVFCFELHVFFAPIPRSYVCNMGITDVRPS